MPVVAACCCVLLLLCVLLCGTCCCCGGLWCVVMPSMFYVLCIAGVFTLGKYRVVGTRGENIPHGIPGKSVQIQRSGEGERVKRSTEHGPGVVLLSPYGKYVGATLKKCD
jgi:hypothetical protein